MEKKEKNTKEKKVVKDNKANLFNQNYPLYYLIVKYGISHLFLAQQLYPAEWDSKSHTTLTGRLRNKLDGKGTIMPFEYSKLITIISDMVNDININLEKAIEIRNKQRSAKIQRLLEGMDEETIQELKKSI